MDLVEKLRIFSVIEGFIGVGLFNSGRECMAAYTKDPALIKRVGISANAAISEVERAWWDTGAGAITMVHIEAEKANVLVKCHNENPDPVTSIPGKAHVHVILLLSSQANVGLAKIRMIDLINGLGEAFWTWCRIKQYTAPR